jgi:hypothetical protein
MLQPTFQSKYPLTLTLLHYFAAKDYLHSVDICGMQYLALIEPYHKRLTYLDQTRKAEHVPSFMR